jgi:hypothetical protein
MNLPISDGGARDEKRKQYLSDQICRFHDAQCEYDLDKSFYVCQCRYRLRDAADHASELIDALIKLHRPFGVYDECEHDHGEDGRVVVRINDVGFVCAEGFLYWVCRECRTGDGYISEDCANGHDHGPDKPICATAAVIEKWQR